MERNIKEKTPNFFDGAYSVGFIEFIITIVTYLLVDINKTIEINIVLKFLILIIAVIGLFIILSIKYVYKVKNHFNKLEEIIKDRDIELNDIISNRNSIIESNNQKDAKIKDLQLILSQTLLAFDELHREINNGITNVSKGEKIYLENLAVSANLKKEHILRMKGEYS